MLRHITSLQHPIVKHLVKLRQNRDYRYEHRRVVVEGIKIIKELAEHGEEFKTVAALDQTLIPSAVKTEETLIVSGSVMTKISGVYSPEGMIAEINMPQPSSLTGCRYILALDGINDPGNLGTLLRTALALKWEGAFILDDSCDPFNDKALRAARGATFRLPLAWGNWEQLQTLIHMNRLKPVVADLHGHPVDQIENTHGLLLVMSNEAHGVSPMAKQICHPITIPMDERMESLNVAIAGGIIMYALREPHVKHER